MVEFKKDTFKYFNGLIADYGKTKILIGLYFIESDIHKLFLKETDSAKLFYCVIPTFFENKISGNDSLFKFIINKIESEEISRRENLLQRLEVWLKADAVLSSVLDDHLSNGLYFGEIISKISETKPILQMYLINPNQYWGSLDENQSCKLYYDVNVYLISLDSRKRLLFFKKYFEVASEIAIKKINK